MKGSQNRLSELRQREELSQAALAADYGVTEQTVSRWERGTTAIPDEAKRSLCEKFDVSVEYLMGWDREPLEKASAAGEVA